MKHFSLFSSLSLYLATSFAQPIPRQSIEDSVLGWMKVYNLKGVKTGMTVDHRIYSANQMSICDSFANWMQASYIPKGGLGDIKKTVLDKLSSYNQHTAGKPLCYGARASTYIFLKYNSSRKIVPENNLGEYWEVSANGVPGNWPVNDICSPTQYYFTLPNAETEENDKKKKALLDLTVYPTIKPYLSMWVKNMGYGGGKEHVILYKDNKSPFIKITRGEYLQALETAIPSYYKKEKKIITEAAQSNKIRLSNDLKTLDEKIDGFKTGLKNNQEKYKNRLDELAMTTSQPGLMNLAFGRDAFNGQYLTDSEPQKAGYPVYKIDPAMAELCKKDEPQWILVSWEFYSNGPTEKQQHEAIVNNFNFAYVYNFFFDPEKVKGQSYKPLRSPLFKEAVTVTEASANSKKITADKNIHFFEDFSTTSIGQKPIGWRSDPDNYGKPISVVKLEGLNGNWVEANNLLIPLKLSKPIPQNFSITYEMVVTKGFAWGSRGLTFQLAKETTTGNAESYLKLKIRPGFDGKGGETAIETKFPAGYLTTSKWVEAPDFSNNQKNNHITVIIKKTGETLQVYIEKQKIADFEKAIPANLLFNTISFLGGGGSGDNDKFYISNIKITKD